MRQTPPSRPEFWIRAAASAFAIDQFTLTGESRTRDIVQFRNATLWIAREMTNFSYPALGRVFGGRDHSTIMHSIAKAEEDATIGGLIEEIFEYVESEL